MYIVLKKFQIIIVFMLYTIVLLVAVMGRGWICISQQLIFQRIKNCFESEMCGSKYTGKNGVLFLA